MADQTDAVHSKLKLSRQAQHTTPEKLGLAVQALLRSADKKAAEHGREVADIVRLDVWAETFPKEG